MPRPKKATKRDADAATILQYFDMAMELKAGQKSKSSEISALNSQMQDDGVDPGVLSLFCRIAAMPEAKAVLYLTLVDRYKVALASRLPDPMAEAPAAIAKSAPNQDVDLGVQNDLRGATHPFGRAQAAAA